MTRLEFLPPHRLVIQSLLLLCTVWVLGPDPAWAHQITLPSVGTVVKNKKGVTIEVSNQNLYDVVQVVEVESGIKISVAGHLNTDKVSAEIHQPDWTSAIRRLLTNYSTIEIGSNPLYKIRILSRTGDVQIVDKGKPAVVDKGNGTLVKNGFIYRPAKRIQKKIWANEIIPYNRDQLEMVVGEEYNAPLPKTVWHDPLFQTLLAKYEIRTEQDLQHLPKARQVRSEAGKMLRVLLKRENQQNNPSAN